MCPDTEFQGKMGVLDLIINILKEHEKNLGNIARKYEKVLDHLYSVESKILSLNETFAKVLFSGDTLPKNKNVAIAQCRDWSEFKERSLGARIVAFEVEENSFNVNSFLGDVVFRYTEFLPEIKIQLEEDEERCFVKKMAFDSPGDLSPVFEKRLKCGLEIFVKGSNFSLSDNERVLQLTYCVDSTTAKNWLAQNLKVPLKKVIEGKITDIHG